MPNHHKHLSSLRIHRGQAMIEYAILLLLLVMIFVGGAEIGSTALASYKTTDAAKTAISEYAEINQQRLNILNAEKQYLMTLAGYGCTTVSFDDSEPDGSYDRINCPATSGTSIIEANSFVNLLDLVNLLPFNAPINPTPIDDGFDNLQELSLSLLKLNTTNINLNSDIESCTPTCNDSVSNDSPLDSNGDGDVLLDEILSKEESVKEQVNSAKKYIKLLILEHLKLSLLPLKTDLDDDGDDDIFLSDATINLGNHNAVSSSAVCNPDGSYDYNIDNQQYFYRKYKDSNGDEQVYQVGSIVYLFQPFAIDVQSCEGVDPNRGNQSKLSILVNGFSRPSSEISPTDPEDDFADTTQGFVPGLPKLNQAMYSLYTKVCVNAANEYISCKDFANVSRTLLKPPGKICFLDGGLNEDNCPNNPNQNEVSGYYMWGRTSASKEGYEIDNVANELATGFRPTYQLDCSPQPNLKGEVGTEFGVIHDTACDSNPSKVRVHTRYRKVFEGFVTLGLMELASTANGELGLFYNPNNVGVTNQVNSVAGSEIGPLGANQRPTVKYFRDFRGCYEVDVETNQVSACN